MSIDCHVVWDVWDGLDGLDGYIRALDPGNTPQCREIK